MAASDENRAYRTTDNRRVTTSAESRTVTGWRKHLAAWREMDSRRRRFGFGVWLTGAEVHIGRRLYRVRWWAR